MQHRPLQIALLGLLTLISGQLAFAQVISYSPLSIDDDAIGTKVAELAARALGAPENGDDAEDYDTPIELARAYFESVTAPHKAFVALPDAGHTALVDAAAAFVAVLNEHALPLATGPR